MAECWVIGGLTQTVEIYRLKEKKYEPKSTFTGGEILNTPLLPGRGRPVRALFSE